MNTELLVLWTIYDHPRDYPNAFVARRWVVERGGERATDTLMTSDTLDWLRDQMLDMGLYRLPRDPADDPSIVETWL